MITDLQNGTKHESRSEDYCTKVTAVEAADGEPALFSAFLERIMGGNQELVSYLQRVFGYCCTGFTSEHAMFFFYGTGANGLFYFQQSLEYLATTIRQPQLKLSPSMPAQTIQQTWPI